MLIDAARTGRGPAGPQHRRGQDPGGHRRAERRLDRSRRRLVRETPGSRQSPSAARRAGTSSGTTTARPSRSSTETIRGVTTDLETFRDGVQQGRTPGPFRRRVQRGRPQPQARDRRRAPARLDSTPRATAPTATPATTTSAAARTRRYDGSGPSTGATAEVTTDGQGTPGEPPRAGGHRHERSPTVLVAETEWRDGAKRLGGWPSRTARGRAADADRLRRRDRGDGPGGVRQGRPARPTSGPRRCRRPARRSARRRAAMSRARRCTARSGARRPQPPAPTSPRRAGRHDADDLRRSRRSAAR